MRYVCSLDKSTDYSCNRYSYYNHKHPCYIVIVGFPAAPRSKLAVKPLQPRNKTLVNKAQLCANTRSVLWLTGQRVMDELLGDELFEDDLERLILNNRRQEYQEKHPNIYG